MSNRSSGDPQHPGSTKGGPPPLRRREPPRAPKPKARAGLKEIIKALRNPTIGTLRGELSHYLFYGLIAFVIIFAVGAFYSFGSKPERDEDTSGESWPVIAKAGRTPLERAEFEQQLQLYGLMRPELVTQRFAQIGQMYDRWVDEQLVAKAAKQRGIKVTAAELNEEIDKQIQQSIDMEKGSLSDRDWKLKLFQQGASEDAYRKELRDKMLADEGGVKAYKLGEKLREAIESEVEIGDEDLHKEYDQISFRVLLVRADSRKPPPPPKDGSETDEQKQQRETQQAQYEKALADKKPAAEKILAEAKQSPAKFVDLIKEKSDDYTKTDGGLIEDQKRSDYSLSRFGDNFVDKLFALKDKAISDLIQTDDGWAIAEVTGRKTWPKDIVKADPRTMDEAKKKADDLYAQLTKGADFAKLAKENSDDPGSKDNGGEYELTGRGVWVKPFEKIAFSLQKDEISKPFKTQFGYHIMQVLERELPEEGEEAPKFEDPADSPYMTDEQKAEAKAELEGLPVPDHKDLKPAKRVKVRHILITGEDPAKKQEDMRKKLLDQKKSEHYDTFMDEQRKQAYDSGWIQVMGPEIKAYLAQKDNDQAAEMYWLQRAAAAWPEQHSEIHWELANLYEQQSGPYGVDSETKVAAAKALESYPPGEVASGLIDALDTIEPDLRKAIINTLGSVKATQAKDKLQEIVKTDPDDSVAEAARAALEKMGLEAPQREIKPLPGAADVGAAPAEKPPTP